MSRSYTGSETLVWWWMQLSIISIICYNVAKWNTSCSKYRFWQTDHCYTELTDFTKLSWSDKGPIRKLIRLQNIKFIIRNFYSYFLWSKIFEIVWQNCNIFPILLAIGEKHHESLLTLHDCCRARARGLPSSFEVDATPGAAGSTNILEIFSYRGLPPKFKTSTHEKETWIVLDFLRSFSGESFCWNCVLFVLFFFCRNYGVFFKNWVMSYVFESCFCLFRWKVDLCLGIFCVKK